MNEKFNFRGSPTQNQDFYMVAVLKSDQIGNFISANTPFFDDLGDGGVDKYFFLCQNQYTTSTGNDYQRLYWSSDPDDFQKSTNLNHQNQGVVKMNSSVSNNNRFLQYRTTISRTPDRIPEPGIYKNFPVNLSRISGTEKGLPISFNVSGSNYNLDSSKLYYSIPYNISNSFAYTVPGFTAGAGNQISWVFRKIRGKGAPASNSSVTIPKPTVAGQQNDMVYNFVNLADLDTITGTSTSNFNYGSVKYDHVDVFTVQEDFGFTDNVLRISPYNNIFNNFPTHYSDIRIENNAGTSYNVIYYDKIVKNRDTAEIYLNSGTYSRGLIANNPSSDAYKDFEIREGNPLKITFNSRNDPECFCTIGSASDFSSYFDIYLIPVEENAKFPGGYVISNQNRFPICDSENLINGGEVFTPLIGNENLRFYNSKSRKPAQSDSEMVGVNANNYINGDCSTALTPVINMTKLFNYKRIYNLLFLNQIGSLNPLIWSQTGIPAFPTIAKHKNFPITFYTWDSWEAARNAYMYDYCTSNSFCGFCFGRNKSGENICFADSLTRKHASLTSSGNVMPPLANNERDVGSVNTGGKVFDFNIMVIVFGSLLGLISFLTILYFRNHWVKDPKHISFQIFIILFLFSLAVLIYMLGITNSIQLCQNNPSPSCPQFSNPTDEDDDCAYCTKWRTVNGILVNWRSDPY